MKHITFFLIAAFITTSQVSAQSDAEKIAEQKTLLLGNWVCSLEQDQDDQSFTFSSFTGYKPDGKYISVMEMVTPEFDLNIAMTGDWDVKPKDVVTSSTDNILYLRGAYSEDLREEGFNELKKEFMDEFRTDLDSIEEQKIILLNKTKAVFLYEDPEDESYVLFQCEKATKEEVEERFGLITR